MAPHPVVRRPEQRPLPYFAMMAFGGENGGRTETFDGFLGQKRGVGVKHQLEEKLLKN